MLLCNSCGAVFRGHKIHGGGGWNGFSTLADYYDLFEGDANNNRLDADGNPIDGQEERRGGFNWRY